MAGAAPPETIDDSYTPAFSPEVIRNSPVRYGAKSSSVPITNRLSAVNSAWWALPSGVRLAPVDSNSSGSMAANSVSLRKTGLAGSSTLSKM
jgi:hypothetical protein